jgi:hypothetical protein
MQPEHGDVEMTYRTLVPVVVVTALLLLGAACSDDGEDDAQLTSKPASENDSSSTTANDDDGQGSTTVTADGGEPSGESTGGGTSESEAPEDQDLDVEMRNPYGVTLRVSGLSFDGGDIFVDAEVINSSTYDATITTWDSGYQLRLVDDAGQTYNYVEAEGQQDSIALAAGESVEGTFAFRGPLSGQPEQLMLVTGVYDEDIAGFDVNDESTASPYEPGFVVPFGLTWN